MNDLVSVIIPVYNDRSIGTAVRSCLQQSYKNIEILVVDDGSDMDIRSLMQTKDERVRFIPNGEHANGNVCRNRGIREAKGKYVAFLDSDDIMLKEHIAGCVAYIEQEKTDGLYSGACINPKAARPSTLRCPKMRRW